MGLSNSSEQFRNTNISIKNSTEVEDQSEDLISKGRLLIAILAVAIMSCVILVIMRCLNEYRKYQRSFWSKDQPQLSCVIVTRPLGFKEELEMVVRRRLERLRRMEGEESDDDEDEQATSSGRRPAGERRIPVMISNLKDVKLQKQKPARRISDEDPDAIEEAPLDLDIGDL